MDSISLISIHVPSVSDVESKTLPADVPPLPPQWAASVAGTGAGAAAGTGMVQRAAALALRQILSVEFGGSATLKQLRARVNPKHIPPPPQEVLLWLQNAAPGNDTVEFKRLMASFPELFTLNGKRISISVHRPAGGVPPGVQAIAGAIEEELRHEPTSTMALTTVGMRVRQFAAAHGINIRKSGWLQNVLQQHPDRFQMSEAAGRRVVSLAHARSSSTLPPADIPDQPMVLQAPTPSLDEEAKSVTAKVKLKYLQKIFGVQQPEKSVRICQVTSLAECKLALSHIANHGVCAVDCEGESLSETGRICIVQICTPAFYGPAAAGKQNILKAYVFDMCAFNVKLASEPYDLSRPHVRELVENGLRTVLESDSILKIIHDSRQDSTALFAQCGIRLRNVFDSQQAAMLLNGDDRRAGLNEVLSKWTSHSNTAKTAVSDLYKRNPGIWRQRPLPPALLEYAVQDVIYLLDAHDAMKMQLEARSLWQRALQLSQDQVAMAIDIADDRDGASSSSSNSNAVPELRPPETPHVLLFDEHGNARLGKEIVDGKGANLDDNDQKTGAAFAVPVRAASAVAGEMEALYSILPEWLQQHVRAIDPDRLVDIVLDFGRRPHVHLDGNDGRIVSRDLNFSDVARDDLDEISRQIGELSLDNRAGIHNTLHRVSALRSRNGTINGFTIRVGRAVHGILKIIRDIVCSDKSVLLVGPPGVGKTTVLREMARVLADDREKRVMVVDTSNEIAGDGAIPHSGIGRARRIEVSTPSKQHAVMLEAVQNHTPEVIIVDEIGSRDEVASMQTIANRGVRLVATVHGTSLWQVVNNQSLSVLVGGVHSVLLSDQEAAKRGSRKSVMQRQHMPVFDVAIELTSRSSWLVYPNVSEVVDAMLANSSASSRRGERVVQGQRREILETDEGFEFVTVVAETPKMQ